MSDGSKGLLTRLALFFLVFAVAVTIGYFMLKPSGELPIFHPSQINAKLVDPEVRHAQGEHHISDFKLVDQMGDTITLKDVKDKVLVADFFFTTCRSICPKMTKQMERVQAKFMDDPRVVILSHSVTPELDTVEVMHAYGELHGAVPKKWFLFTGERAQIYALARRSYFAATTEGDGGPDDFVHTENFVLIDPQQRIRGFYDGTSKQDVDKLIVDVAKLLKD